MRIQVDPYPQHWYPELYVPDPSCHILGDTGQDLTLKLGPGKKLQRAYGTVQNMAVTDPDPEQEFL